MNRDFHFGSLFKTSIAQFPKTIPAPKVCKPFFHMSTVSLLLSALTVRGRMCKSLLEKRQAVAVK
jgi:hypothetical protein